MNSSDFGTQLELYADGELDDPVCQLIEAAFAQQPAARAEVARWRALRASAHRGLRSTPVPPDLRQRVTELLTQQRRRPLRRIWPLAATMAAAAALLLLTVSYRVPNQTAAPSAVHLVAAADFAHICEKCARARHHDSLQVARLSAAQAADVVQADAASHFAAATPDFQARGFCLTGGCRCSPVPGVPAVHLHYCRGADVPAGSAEIKDVVSFFILAAPVKFTDGAPSTLADCGAAQQRRAYHVAHTADAFNVVGWREHTCSYAVCGGLGGEELMRLAEGVDVAALTPTEYAGWADVSRLRSWPAFVVGLIGVAGWLLARRRHAPRAAPVAVVRER
jgi:anti-sigma factor RsiW